MCDSSIDLQNFFPRNQFKITNVSESDTDIKIKLKSQNSNCTNKTIVESFEGFISYYSRMTERLSDFLCSLALETS